MVRGPKRRKGKHHSRGQVKRKMAKKVKVDKVKCIGCGTCVVIAEKSFKMGDDGKSQPIEPPGDSETKIKEAIDNCPVDAISWKGSK